RPFSPTFHPSSLRPANSVANNMNLRAPLPAAPLSPSPTESLPRRGCTTKPRASAAPPWDIHAGEKPTLKGLYNNQTRMLFNPFRVDIDSNPDPQGRSPRRPTLGFVVKPLRGKELRCST